MLLFQMYLSYHSFSQVMLYPDPISCRNSTLKQLRKMAKLATTAMKYSNGGKRIYEFGMSRKVLASDDNSSYQISGAKQK